MSLKPESQALMMATGSDSEGSDVTDFASPNKNGRRRAARNGTTSTAATRPKKGVCCSYGNLNALALALSAIINVVLVCVLIVTHNQNVPVPCSQVHPPQQQTGSQTNCNDSSKISSTTSSPSLSSPTTSTPSPTTTTSTTTPFSLHTPPPKNNLTCVTSTETCGQDAQHVEPPVDAGYVNIFRDLSAEEISAAVEYINQQMSVTQRRDRLENRVFGVELHVPTKELALKFLESSQSPPAREALVSMILMQETPPVFRQYVVGPLPHPTYYKVNPRMSKDVPVSKLTLHGFRDAYSHVYQQLAMPAVVHILQESFGVSNPCVGLSEHTAPCLVVLAQKISFGLMNRTSFVFTAYYNAEFPIIHPLPLQLIISEMTPGSYTTQSVYYAGTTFSSLPELVARYNQSNIHTVSRKYPVNATGQSSIPGSMNLRGKPFPETLHPPPRQYEPKGSRFSIVNQHVKYLEWSFNVRNSVESGPQFWDITWSGERIVYELSLQEIVVLYAGANPAAMFAHLSDSAFGLGDNAKGLVPGVDCPEHASFLSTWAYNGHSATSNTKELRNTVCVFEHNSGVPLRRHRTPGHVYGALVDHYLVVRTIIVEFNYDYIVDMVFHANGALEVRLYATGYIMSQWFHYGEDPFGFRVHDDVVGSVHHHLFHLKLDMDVGGVNNRYETLDFDVDDRDWPWLSTMKPSATTSSASSRSFQQITFKHHVRKTEQDAVYHYDFDNPKYHIFYTDQNKNPFGNSRAYRLHAHGFSKQLLPTAHPAVRSRKWMQHCMAVTERKEEEAKSSSIFSMYDADDPVVDFDDFLQDNGSILDKDLVTWVTLGMHHIPHTEDIPNTPTVGTEASILLLPYNYFPEDPSMRSRDAVRAEHSRVDGVTHFQTYGSETQFTCLPRMYGWLNPSESKSHT